MTTRNQVRSGSLRCEPRRHHDRVAISSLQHRHRAGLQQTVLPDRRSCEGCRATSSVGFVARPVGGVGHFGDKTPKIDPCDADDHGRGNVFIGCLPEPTRDRPWAAVLLILPIAGFGVGGEWGGRADGGRTCPRATRVHGSWPRSACRQVSCCRPRLFPVSRMPEAAFLSWGWRAVSDQHRARDRRLIIRVHSETPAFERTKATSAGAPVRSSGAAPTRRRYLR